MSIFGVCLDGDVGMGFRADAVAVYDVFGTHDGDKCRVKEVSQGMLDEGLVGGRPRCPASIG